MTFTKNDERFLRNLAIAPGAAPVPHGDEGLNAHKALARLKRRVQVSCWCAFAGVVFWTSAHLAYPWLVKAAARIALWRLGI
jgi:hypothetical protein